MITTLAGGVGAARFLKGLSQIHPPDDLVAIINTADDTLIHGLHISPDIDTVTYSLAGIDNPETGWGVVDDTWEVMKAVELLEGSTWFRLGDRDIGTHLYRTGRLNQGASLNSITDEIRTKLGVRIKLLPMSNEKVSTHITLVEGKEEISFQEYFVKRKHSVPISKISFHDVEESKPAPGVLDSIVSAEKLIIAPSNPLVSINPILAVPGISAAVQERRESNIAISPIVGGTALKGPADRMLKEMGYESSVLGVARLYNDFASTLVIDSIDSEFESSIESLGMRCISTDTIMKSSEVSKNLAKTVLES
tara:strand:+ start:4261 stop:5184 length:924 start_codon:yes stop_codon:yes gene_type:complete